MNRRLLTLLFLTPLFLASSTTMPMKKQVSHYSQAGYETLKGIAWTAVSLPCFGVAYVAKTLPQAFRQAMINNGIPASHKSSDMSCTDSIALTSAFAGSAYACMGALHFVKAGQQLHAACSEQKKLKME